MLVSLQSQEEEEEEKEDEKEDEEGWRHAPPGGRARGVHQICWHSVLPKLQMLQGKNALVTEVTDSMEEEVLLLP